jgi:hypothetical protein
LSLLTSQWPQAQARELFPETALRLSRRAPVTLARSTTSADEPTMDLYFAGKEISVVGPWVPFLATLVATRDFRAGDSTRWFESAAHHPWAVVRESLRALLDQGILEWDDASA